MSFWHQDDGARLVVTCIQDVLDRELGGNLVGIYPYGSLAFGDYTPDTSDMDVLAVAATPPVEEARQRIVETLARRVPELPGAGLDFSLMDAADAASPPDPPSLLIALGMYRGWNWKPDVTFDEAGEPTGHIAPAVILQTGAHISGAPPAEVFSPVPRAFLLRAVRGSVAWWMQHDEIWMPRSAVLNACRAWRLAEEGVLSSKLGGGAWALEKGIGYDQMIAAAMVSQQGGPNPEVTIEQIRALLEETLARIDAVAG